MSYRSLFKPWPTWCQQKLCWAYTTSKCKNPVEFFWRKRRQGVSLTQTHHLNCRTNTFRPLAQPTFLLPCKIGSNYLSRVQTGILFSSQQTKQQITELWSSSQWFWEQAHIGFKDHKNGDGSELIRSWWYHIKVEAHPWNPIAAALSLEGKIPLLPKSYILRLSICFL